MTERTFDQKVEYAAGCLERAVEAGASRLDQGLTAFWEDCALFRWVQRVLELLAGAGLLAAAKHFADAGRRAAALWCAVLGAAVLAAALLRILLFRKE